jgi:hypothetical protein
MREHKTMQLEYESFSDQVTLLRLHVLATRRLSSSNRQALGSTPLRGHGRTVLTRVERPRSWGRTNNPDDVVADGDTARVLHWPF